MLRTLALSSLVALGVASLATQAQAQYPRDNGYRPGYLPNQGSTYNRSYYQDYGRAPSGRYQAPPRQTYRAPRYPVTGRAPSRRYQAPPRPGYTPSYRPPGAYLPGGSLHSPFNMGHSGLPHKPNYGTWYP